MNRNEILKNVVESLTKIMQLCNIESAWDSHAASIEAAKVLLDLIERFPAVVQDF